MLLQEVAHRFCQTPLFYFTNNSWRQADVLCRVPPYDRFISDRAFGQKKRLLQIPGDQDLPTSNYYRVGRANSRTFMIESLNEDQDEHGEYLNIHMIREAHDQCRIMIQDTTAQRPSGVSKPTWVEQGLCWVDLDRFGVLRSSELDVDYTSYTITLPKNVQLPDDCRLIIDNQSYAITENFTQLELRQLRVRGIS